MLGMRTAELDHELDVLLKRAAGRIRRSDVYDGTVAALADEQLRVQTQQLPVIRDLGVVRPGTVGDPAQRWILDIERRSGVVEYLDLVQHPAHLRLEARELFKAADEREVVWHL